MSWLISLAVLSFLIIVHEAGHFVVARWMGVRVLRFAIGFGPVLARWERGGVEYCLCLLPLGGYVKMAGEEERAHDAPASDEFSAKPASVRALIIAAGPIVNALVSTLALWVVLVIGYPELVPSVGRVMDGMPAQAAGMREGDRITAVDGRPVTTWEDLTRVVHGAAGRSLAVAVDRAGASVALTITPKPQEMTDPFGRRQTVGLMGIGPSGAFITYRVDPVSAVGKTLQKQAEFVWHMGLSLWALFTGHASMKESLTGPIGIAQMISEQARMGLSPLLYLASLFSLSLAIFNAFPLPLLDGGHLLFLAIERLRGRPVSLRVQEKSTQVSMAFLLLIAAVVSVNDLERLRVLEKIQHWWRN